MLQRHNVDGRIERSRFERNTRQIADYMAQVGATSRFQAGVIASRAGHIDSTVIT